MRDNFYDEWTQVWRSYFCNRPPEKDDQGKDDPTQTSIGMPGTFSHIERMVHRITAQPPNVRYHTKDPELSKLISRKIMLDWDKGQVQRWQKKHVRQACLFGWSVRAWHWLDDVRMRRRRVNPFTEAQDPDTLRSILRQYGEGVTPEQFGMMQPWQQKMLLVKLLADNGRGNLLPVEYPYTAYHGAKSDVLFVGDCYPEPNFTTLQSSGFLIIERRRKREWLDDLAKNVPEFAPGIEKFLKAVPNGTPRRFFGNRDTACLRDDLEGAIGRSSDDAAYDNTGNQYQREWVMTEMWIPGRKPKLKLVGEDDHWIGEIDAPHDLEGKIPFTDLVLIDDQLCGIGNANARIMRGIQQLHDRQVCQRVDLVYNILRPLIGTSSYELYNNPDMIKRGKGMRLVKMRGAGDIWVQPEQAAMAAVATGLQDESGLWRLWQVGTNESNLSMAANVDPQQARTATGAKLMQASQDVLVNGVNQMFMWAGLNQDVEMIYLLNRSEMAEDVEFDVVPYDRERNSKTEMEWVKVTPLMFQQDGEIIVEAGSTLADDDEANVGKAMNLYQAALSAPPGLWNAEKARDELLIAQGKRHEIAEWAGKPTPEPTAEPPKTSVSFSIKWEMLGLEEQQAVLQAAGIEKPQQGPPPPGMEQQDSGPPPTGPQPVPQLPAPQEAAA